MVSNSPTSFTLIINGVVLTSGTIYSAGYYTSTTGTATVALSANSSLGIISIGTSVLPTIENALTAILDVVRIG